MFDNLRQKSAEQAEFIDEEAVPAVPAATADEPKAAKPRAARRSGPFLGLSPAQRFLLAVMLFLNVTVLGLFALLVFNKIALPFF